MILAEYTLDHPILRETLRSGRADEVVWESSHTGPDGEQRFIAWVESDDFGAFESAAGEDPTVRNPTVLTEAGGRRLYRFELAGAGEVTSLMPVLMGVGGVHQHLVGTAEGWRNRTRFPDRAAFERVYRFCRDNDIGFRFERIWEHGAGGEAVGGRLTDGQREILRAAVECGYLDVPRGCSLAELGERVGISESAASERFRRAAKALVEGTL